MNQDIINKLKNSPLEADNLLALEYIFPEFIAQDKSGGTDHSRTKRFIRYVNKGEEVNWIFLGEIHIAPWFRKRYKEYLINKYEHRKHSKANTV